MSQQSGLLDDLSVLVVEDDYAVALDLARSLAELGADVIGPVPSVEQALQVIGEHQNELDAAVLDINLGSHTVYPVADLLLRQGVPFVFATGYDSWSIPEAYRNVPLCYKPVDPADVVQHFSASAQRH